MKTICIYHSRDLDGWMSAAIVKKWWEETQDDGDIWDNIEFFGWDYGDKILELSGYEKVIMCDISFPTDTMVELYDRLDNNFIWIDHHVSAINPVLELAKKKHISLFNGLLNTEFAACELTWNFFFPNDSMPEIVRLLGRYDCFGHKGTDEEKYVLEFQYGARSCIKDYKDAYI